jgi:hypothetical protein
MPQADALGDTVAYSAVSEEPESSLRGRVAPGRNRNDSRPL